MSKGGVRSAAPARIVSVRDAPESIWPKDAAGRSTEPGGTLKRPGG
jgi:hypothetical protein